MPNYYVAGYVTEDLEVAARDVLALNATDGTVAASTTSAADGTFTLSMAAATDVYVLGVDSTGDAPAIKGPYTPIWVADYRAAVLASSPDHYYYLDADATDATGSQNGSDSSGGGTVNYSQAAIHTQGAAVTYTGDACIVLPAAVQTANNGGTALSFECVYKVGANDATATPVLIGFYSAATHGFLAALSMVDSGGLKFKGTALSNASDTPATTYSAVVTPGQVYHLVVTINLATDTFVMYVDNVAYDSTEEGNWGQGSFASFASSGRNPMIGALNDQSAGGTWQMTGSLSDVAVYRRELSAQEVADHFAELSKV